LATGSRGYKNQVRLRGLMKNQGFETCVVRYAQRKRDRQVKFRVAAVETAQFLLNGHQWIFVPLLFGVCS
jgi:hypothetical protein